MMKIDLNNNAYSAKQGTYDVCVCGAGAAGITIARELAKNGKKVALFEAGGLELTKESQDIYTGKNIGLPYWGVDGCRLRYFGGTTNHWAGRCMEFQPIDFEERDYFELPGWPISKGELDKHSNKTRKILDIENQSFEGKTRPELSSSSSFTTVGYAVSPPTRFGSKYLDELVSSNNIDLYLNANLTDIRLNKNTDHVNSIEIKNYNGDTYSFVGKRYIIALGAIENARILLNSSSQIKSGIGNHSDFVGRCFMEHLTVDFGRYVIDNENDFWKPSNLDAGDLEIFPSREFLHRSKIGSSVIVCNPKASYHTGGRLKKLKEILHDTACSSDGIAELTRKFMNLTCPGDGAFSTVCEQSPNKNSRVTLSDDRDTFGLRRVQLDWQINDFDRHTIRTLAMEVAKELARLDLARVQLADFIIDKDKDIEIYYHCHHMGTTRMAKSQEYGVVDPNCRVFGIDNLYVAGSSVFSTGGGVNPTFPVIQLSLRLAEHLKPLT